MEYIINKEENIINLEESSLSNNEFITIKDFDTKKYLTLSQINSLWKSISAYPFLRYFARSVDNSIYLVIATIILAIFNYNLETINILLIFFFSLIIMLLIEPILLSLFWKTLWKKIAWMKILSSDLNKLNYINSLKRTFFLIVLWMWCGIKLLSVISWMYQYKYLVSWKYDYNTSYDKDEFVVLYKKISIFRWIILLFLFIWIFALNFL